MEGATHGGTIRQSRATPCTVCRHRRGSRARRGGPTIAAWTDRLLDVAIVATKVATIGFGIDAWINHRSPRLRGKAIRTRAIGYTGALFIVPVVWRLLPSRGDYPRVLDLAVTAPLLADAGGNAIGIYNEKHVDDVVHGANAAILAAVAGGLVAPYVDEAWQAALIGAGTAVVGEAAWEVMEYVALRLGQDGMNLSYEDTMDDMVMTWIGAAAGAAYTATRGPVRLPVALPDRA